MPPVIIAELAKEILRFINNIMEGIPPEHRQQWFRDNEKFWQDAQQFIAKLASGEVKLPDFKLPEFKLPDFKLPAPPKP